MKQKRVFFAIGMALLIITILLTVVPIYATHWISYLYGLNHTSKQAAEIKLSQQNAATITKHWKTPFQADTNVPDPNPNNSGKHITPVIAASPVVDGNTVYVGSWNGYLYALDSGTGALKWKRFLGVIYNTRIGCNPPTMGVEAAVQVYNNVVYVAAGDSTYTPGSANYAQGGNGFFYALDAETGNIRWRTQVYSQQVHGDYANWASTVIATVKGTPYAFIGSASLCDNPLTRGQIWKINLNTHTIDGTYYIVPANQTGGGIWTTPAIDTTTNPPTMYVTSGTPTLDRSGLGASLIAINTQTLTTIASWAWTAAGIGESDFPDEDFGSSPTLFTTNNGTPMIIAGHKSGYVYAWPRKNLAAGYTWKVQIDPAGECPQCGQGVLSTPVFAQNVPRIGNALFVAGGNDPTDTSIPGTVRALSPDKGTQIWKTSVAQNIIASMAYANGILVYVTTGPAQTLGIINATNGKIIKTFDLSDGSYATPTIANGIIFTGDNSGKVSAFAVA
jgi:outer membrane protein assembly factor BamB